MNLPILLSADEVSTFSYHQGGESQSVMMMHGRLYGLLNFFSEEERLLVYEKGCQLSKEHDVVITVSQKLDSKYYLWISPFAYFL